MAITFTTDKLQGLPTSVSGVYARVQSVTVKKYDATTEPVAAVQWRCLYDVVLHASAAVRNASGESPEWSNRLRSREIDHFTATVTVSQMNAADANCYTLAYSDLKTKIASIASSITDA